jgi:hypothetical protein
MEKVNVLINHSNANAVTEIDRILSLDMKWEITFQDGFPRIRAIEGIILVEPVYVNVVKIIVK